MLKKKEAATTMSDDISETYQGITIVTHEHEHVNRRRVISYTYAPDRSILWIMVDDNWR